MKKIICIFWVFVLIYTTDVLAINEESKKSNTNLENLAIENVLLNPPFDYNITHYNINVLNDITDLNILAVPQNENANVEIVGGNDLEEGENLIKINIISENGISNKVYEIVVYRMNVNESLAYMKNKSVANDKLQKIYEAKKTSLNVEKENNNNYLMILGSIIFMWRIFKIRNVLQKCFKWISKKLHYMLF